MSKLRIRFLPGEQSKFIDLVYKRSGLSTIQLASLIGIHRRSLIDWRLEKSTMTLSGAEFFCKRFNLDLPETKESLLKRWQDVKREANRKGGLVNYLKNGNFATPEGRKKGGLSSLTKMRNAGIIPGPNIFNYPASYNEELAEFIGIMLGDGHLGALQCSITLNSVVDYDYALFVMKLGENLFGKQLTLSLRRDSKAIILLYSGVLLMKYFVSVGLKIGNKVKQQVGIPNWILSSTVFKKACLRGLMDTDGGIFLNTYKSNGKDYMYKKICFTNRSVPILLFVFNTLKELGFTPCLIDKVENKKVWLYNAKDVKQYFEIIGTHNRRLEKYHNLVL